MKRNIILTITLICFLAFGIFIGYRIGFNRGYNYTFPIQNKEDVNNVMWLSNARGRAFGKFVIYKPRDKSIASLWIVPIDKPHMPAINIEKNGENMIIMDKKENSIHIGYDNKLETLNSLSYFFDGGHLMDFNLNGTWDCCIKKQKEGYYNALQVNSVWYEYTSIRNEVKGKKDYLFINTKDGKKEVLRENGDYYIKSEQD